MKRLTLKRLRFPEKVYNPPVFSHWPFVILEKKKCFTSYRSGRGPQRDVTVGYTPVVTAFTKQMASSWRENGRNNWLIFFRNELLPWWITRGYYSSTSFFFVSFPTKMPPWKRKRKHRTYRHGDRNKWLSAEKEEPFLSFQVSVWKTQLLGGLLFFFQLPFFWFSYLFVSTRRPSGVCVSEMFFFFSDDRISAVCINQGRLHLWLSLFFLLPRQWRGKSIKHRLAKVINPIRR